MDRSVELHTGRSPGKAMVPVQQVAAEMGYEFNAVCKESCQKLGNLLMSRVPDSQVGRDFAAEQLEKATNCPDGPQKRLLSRTGCSTNL